MLNAYITATQLLLHDTNANFYSVNSLTSYINTARGRVAADAQCIRVLPPSSAAIASPITITSGGTGYVAPTIAISAPDIITGITATATATISGGIINSVTLTNPGSGYLNPPKFTITDVSGTGAVLTATLTTYLSTSLNQEVYPFSYLNTFAQQTAGVQAVHGVLSVAVMQGAPGAYKPVLNNIAWGALQAYCRSYSSLVSNYPYYWSQYGQGVNGSFYLYPIPSGTYPMDVDCYCLPIALINDSTVEAIPYPWTDAVPYYAAYLALLNAQRKEDAMGMLNDYKMKMMEGGGFSRPVVIPSYYGRKR